MKSGKLWKSPRHRMPPCTKWQCFRPMVLQPDPACIGNRSWMPCTIKEAECRSSSWNLSGSVSVQMRQCIAAVIPWSAFSIPVRMTYLAMAFRRSMAGQNCERWKWGGCWDWRNGTCAGEKGTITLGDLQVSTDSQPAASTSSRLGSQWLCIPEKNYPWWLRAMRKIARYRGWQPHNQWVRWNWRHPGHLWCPSAMPLCLLVDQASTDMALASFLNDSFFFIHMDYDVFIRLARDQKLASEHCGLAQAQLASQQLGRFIYM